MPRWTKSLLREALTRAEIDAGVVKTNRKGQPVTASYNDADWLDAMYAYGTAVRQPGSNWTKRRMAGIREAYAAFINADEDFVNRRKDILREDGHSELEIAEWEYNHVNTLFGRQDEDADFENYSPSTRKHVSNFNRGTFSRRGADDFCGHESWGVNESCNRRVNTRVYSAYRNLQETRNRLNELARDDLDALVLDCRNNHGRSNAGIEVEDGQLLCRSAGDIDMAYVENVEDGSIDRLLYNGPSTLFENAVEENPDFDDDERIQAVINFIQDAM